jgi:hypothetical protein
LQAFSGDAHGAEYHYQSLEVAGIVQQLEQGDQQENLSDSQSLKEEEKVWFSSDLYWVSIVLQYKNDPHLTKEIFCSSPTTCFFTNFGIFGSDQRCATDQL